MYPAKGGARFVWIEHFREENEIAAVKLLQSFLTPVIHYYFTLENGQNNELLESKTTAAI